MTNSPSNLAVLCGLAANPSTPLPVLLRLAEHPHHGDQSPSAALLGREHLPAELAEALASHPEVSVRKRLTAHPSTPDSIRAGLAADAEPAVRATVAKWPRSWLHWHSNPRQITLSNLPDEIYRALAADGAREVRLGVAWNRYVPEAIRALLTDDADPEIRRAAAYEGLPPDVLRRLLTDPDDKVRATALDSLASRAPEAPLPEELTAPFENDRFHGSSAVQLVELTPSVFARLWADPDEHWSLARNQSLTTDQMRIFIDSGFGALLGGNPAVPEHLVAELVATDDPEVHRELLRRKDVPDHLRRRLLADDESVEYLPIATSLLPEHAGLEVRLSYLDHPNPAFRRTLTFSTDLPESAQHRLAEDPDFSTRLLACERFDHVSPAALHHVLEHHGGHSREFLLRHPRLSADTMRQHATGDDDLNREVLASRPDLGTELALLLLGDAQSRVRNAAAANPCLPHSRIRELLTDSSPTLRGRAASNPALTAEEIEELLRDNW